MVDECGGRGHVVLGGGGEGRLVIGRRLERVATPTRLQAGGMLSGSGMVTRHGRPPGHVTSPAGRGDIGGIAQPLLLQDP